jgi:hypothetical protein
MTLVKICSSKLIGAVRHVCDGGVKVKAKIWGGIEKLISRNAVAKADIESSLEQVIEEEVIPMTKPTSTHLREMYTEQEYRESFEFLDHLKGYDVPYSELVYLLNESVDMTIKYAVMTLNNANDPQVIEDYLRSSDVRPGILYDGSRLAPIAYTTLMKHQLANNGNYVIASYPLLKIFSH